LSPTVLRMAAVMSATAPSPRTSASAPWAR
jgi:hypothetical protein